jgi:hypothetical protein
MHSTSSTLRIIKLQGRFPSFHRISDITELCRLLTLRDFLRDVTVSQIPLVEVVTYLRDQLSWFFSTSSNP